MAKDEIRKKNAHAIELLNLLASIIFHCKGQTNKNLPGPYYNKKRCFKKSRRIFKVRV